MSEKNDNNEFDIKELLVISFCYNDITAVFQKALPSKDIHCGFID